MTNLILFFSIRGNNRLLAARLTQQIGAESEKIRDARWFPRLHMPRDLMRDALPPIRPIAADLADVEHVLFVSPVFAGKIAMPMKSAIAAAAPGVPAYSFVSFCGYDSPDQRTELMAQLVELAGRPPAHIAALCVRDLVPEKDRRNRWVISNYRVSEPQLARFSGTVAEITAWFPA